MTPYLIQRATTKTVNRDGITGIDSFLSFDYMGSSEFEWGALPKALKEVIKLLPALVITNTGIRTAQNLEVIILSTPENCDSIAKFLREELSGIHHKTKESVDFKRAVKGEKYANTNCWWDIENSWFAILGESGAKLLLYALQKTKEKREATAV